jgi:hypothetical protein
MAIPSQRRNGETPEPMSERVIVRRFPTYRDAKRAVDRLRVASIPARRITVMGQGLRWREAFTAERAIRVAGVVGAAVAAATALLLWSLGGLASEFTWLGAIASGGFIGGAFGVIAGALGWRLTRDAKDVPETGHVDVDRYDLLVESRDAEKAKRLLADVTS